MQCTHRMLASLTVAGVLAVGGFTLLSSAQAQQPLSAHAQPSATQAQQSSANARQPNAQTQVAAQQSATFVVENMTCAVCPITVRTAMQGVDGVKSVRVDFEAKTATVIFDPAITSVEQIGAASANVGYPAVPVS